MRTEGLPIMTSGAGVRLIDGFLGEQGDLSAVERFSQWHEDATAPLQGRFYSTLIPGRTPGPGEQYAFEVDLDRCSGCKACVAACHSLNGLDEHEAWREVGLIIGGPPTLPVLQHVTSACHHCVDPACLNACPVDAYEKDPVTGIVKHLDDQCFGCQYCTLACPYDAPKFHPGKGIVRKCDMCSDRLGAGEAPACVQGCPHEAIAIRVVSVADIVHSAEVGSFLPSAPEPSYTLPTTRYVSKRAFPGPLRAADHYRNQPEHAHTPLAVMLVLTQASAGAFTVDFVGRLLGLNVPFALPAIALGIGLFGINVSLLHLGRPLYAYRAIIGLRHSWLSREIAAFGLFALLAQMHTAAAWLYPGLATATAATVSAAGAFAIACSVMVYHVVRRPFWHASISGPKFAGTAAVLGLAVALVATNGSRGVALGLVGATAIKLLIDVSVMSHLRDPRLTMLKRTAVLLRSLLAHEAIARVVLGFVGGIVMPLTLGGRAGAIAALVTVLGGELVERYLFFAAVVRPKMPGGMSS